MQGNYQGKAPYLISPVQGMQAFTSQEVTHVKGCDVACSSDSGFSAAVAAAKQANVTVLIMGLDQSRESEGHDRNSIAFPGKQDALIASVANVTDVILVVMAGGMVDLTAAKANPKVVAILWVGYPGQSGGQAIAETLFGRNPPAGKLTQTIYPASYVDQCSMFDMNMRPNGTCPGRSHRFYTGAAVYKFGDGLSLSTWSHAVSVDRSTVHLSKYATTAPAGDRFWSSTSPAAPVLTTATIVVVNTGDVVSDHTVLLFAVPPATLPGDGAPLRTLVGFQRLRGVQPGQKVVVHIPVKPSALSYATRGGSREMPPGSWRLNVEDATARLDIA